MTEEGIGRPIPPAASHRYVQGRGNYTDDHRFPSELVMVLLRSPHAAAHIRSVDVSAARDSPHVVAVLTGEDIANAGLGHIRSVVQRWLPGGRKHVEPAFPLLARTEVNHVGFPVAAVVAETIAAARDAAELVEIDYELKPAVTATRDLLSDAAPRIWPEAPGNLCFIHEVGDRQAVDTAFARASHIAAADIDVTRVSANPMEPRNAIAQYDERTGRLTLWTGSQSPHELRAELAAILGLPEVQLRVISPDIGGAFGLKIAAGPELALALHLARLTGRTVRWQADRTEAFVSDWHARDIASHVELALDSQGIFLAMRVTSTANLGAYLGGLTLHSSTNNLGGLAGMYRTPAIFVRVLGAFSNTNPTAPYRGAGRPEATYAIERIIDLAAQQMAIDRVELRRRNMIPPSAMPFRTGLNFTYDCGEFERNMDAALALADWHGFARRRAEALGRGRLRGIGLANAIESAGGPAGTPLEEFLELRFDASGRATIVTGLHSHGHGLETVLPQVLNTLLDVPLSQVRMVFGDTDLAYLGHGSGGSRSAAVGSAVLREAAHRVIEKGRRIAANVLEADVADVGFATGKFSVNGTDLALSLADVAGMAFQRNRLPDGMDMGLAATVALPLADICFPNGCHICEVEIDPETGSLAIVGYWTVEDVGRVLNPLVVEGQIQGGVAQGIGQALLEAIHYDPQSGQLMNASFMDYAMPRAMDVPSIVSAFNEVLTKGNPLGVKGAGEAGTVGALAAVMSAGNDALASVGAGPLEMPATPFRIWQALSEASSLASRQPDLEQKSTIAADSSPGRSGAMQVPEGHPT